MTMIPPWNDRAAEDQSLFNPAFCGLLLRTACRGFNEGSTDERSMPLPQAFIILPIVLNARMRDTLPTLKTLMSTWVAAHPEHVAEFGDRAREMADVTREAIQFGCSQAWLAISGRGLSTGVARLRPDPPKLATDTDDVRACYAAARFLGRWLPKDEQTSTILSLLGVAP
ncbi:three component ABC system middle component [Sphingomonas sp. RT2P30]|uniref:three component ABC system middle component n=1 Tax=Parasphingomonas halimpatiens TaxID=3096162 RepID=UPI002FCB8883